MKKTPVFGRARTGILFLWLAFLCSPALGEAKSVVFPMTIDFSLLRSMVVYTTFRGVDESVVILDECEGCRNITLSRPLYGGEEGRIRFETRVSVRLGTPVGGDCLLPVTWEGIVVLFQRPVILPGTWTLFFETEDSTVLTADREPAKVAGLVWDFVKPRVHEFLKTITVNLGPPVADVKDTLLPLFREDSRERARKMFESLRPGSFTVDGDGGGLRLEVLAELEEPAEGPLVKTAEKEELSEETLNRFINSWEVWDTYLISILMTLSRQPLTEEDREIFLTTLLDARYRFVDALSEGGDRGDFVREEFITAWKSLSPVFRRHLGDEPSRNLFRFLAFFTASDALETIDRIGPTLGIEISRNGWIRLMGLLTDEKEPLLPYDYTVSAKLRRVLGLGRAPDFPGPAFEGEEWDTGEPEEEAVPEDGKEGEVPEGGEVPEDGEAGERDGGTGDALRRWPASWAADWIVSRAWAGEAGESPPADPSIRKWVVDRSNLDEYMKRVRGLLLEQADGALKESRIPKDYHDLYHDLVLATAWQESCFRQFREKKGKIQYLRSYNGTSVGIMQVNERVWRGLYEGGRLRWDITYNAMAGCRILELYLFKYVLNRRDRIEKEIALDDDLMARMVYAVYNGGPSQVNKFAGRVKSGKFYNADTLFSEKYEWVKKGDWDKIRKCLIGG